MEEIVPAETIIFARVRRSQLVHEHRVQSELAIGNHKVSLWRLSIAVTDETGPVKYCNVDQRIHGEECERHMRYR